MASKVSVFVSSSIVDLIDERTFFKKSINKDLFDVFLSEYEGSNHNTPFEICKNSIQKADFIILLLGRRYGHVPTKIDGTPYNGDISVTHLEYKIAKQNNIPMLIYIKDLNHYENKQQVFIDEVRDFFRGNYISNFKDINELEKRIQPDIANLLSQLINNKYRFPVDKKYPLIIKCNTDSELYNCCAQSLIWVLKNASQKSLLLSGGRTNSQIYATMFDNYEKIIKEIEKIQVITNFEYFGVSGSNTLSRQSHFKELFVSKIERIEGKAFTEKNEIFYIPGIVTDSEKSLDTLYDIIDFKFQTMKPFIAIQPLSPKGEFAGICPSSYKNLKIREFSAKVMSISPETSKHLKPTPKSPLVITIGTKNFIENIRYLFIPFSGSQKSKIFKRFVLGEHDASDFAASILKKHNNLIVPVDKDAASKTLKNYPPDRIIDYDKVNFDDIFN